MKNKVVLATAALIIFLPAAALAHTFSLRLGAFFPQAPANLASYPDSLWAIEFDQMSFKKSDFRGSLLGGSFEFFLNSYLSLTITVDTYTKDNYGYYKDYIAYGFEEGDFAFPAELYIGGDSIIHTFRVSITPIQFSAKLTPMGRRGRIVPFVGGGIGYYRWGVTLRGQTVDFSDTTWVYEDPEIGEVQIYPIIQSLGHETGFSFGYHAMAGFQVPIGHRITIEGEARYHWAKAEFDEWFLGFEEFHIGGLSLTAGLNFWF